MVADSIGCTPTELVFTSGGTEANNLAILGLVRSSAVAGKHVITTRIEHPAVLEPFRQLEREGVRVTYVDVQPNGSVDPAAIAEAIRPETVLVSIMHGNNETGAIQPIREVASFVRECRVGGQQIYFHSDGVQALGKIDVDVEQLGVDLYSMSAHKIYGPKGVGAVYVRKGTPLRAVQFGGRHERDRRAGTENVPGAIAFACALELAGEYSGQQLSRLRDRFEMQVCSEVEGVTVNASKVERLPNTSSLTFAGLSGEVLLIALDTQGFAVSTGSACSSGSIEPSHVLLAMGLSPAEARASVRFSFGRYNTEEEVDKLADAVIECVRRLRKSRTRRPELVAQ